MVVVLGDLNRFDVVDSLAEMQNGDIPAECVDRKVRVNSHIADSSVDVVGGIVACADEQVGSVESVDTFCQSKNSLGTDEDTGADKGCCAVAV